VAISEITRRAIIDELSLSKFHWSGRLEEPEFLARLYKLKDLPSTDGRFKDAAGDIWQHRVNNNDWDDDWVFYDSRFDLMEDDEEFQVERVMKSGQGEVAQEILDVLAEIFPGAHIAQKYPKLSADRVDAAWDEVERDALPLLASAFAAVD
jgi:hypothetical protein